MQKSVFVGKQFINMFLTSNMFYNHNIAIPVKKKSLNQEIYAQIKYRLQVNSLKHEQSKTVLNKCVCGFRCDNRKWSFSPEEVLICYSGLVF